jgi:peroxiredoxin
MKQFFLAFIAILGTISAKSQTINIDLSHFGGKSYYCLAVEGQKYDTIAKGKLDKSGKAVIVFKDRYKGYKGMSRFLLTEGGGLDLVINKENFTVSCKEEVPNSENIHFIGSPENEYFINTSMKKTQLLQKAELAKAVLATYNKADAVYAPFEKEQTQLNDQYKALRNSNTQSPLYAARVLEIFDFLIGNSNDLKDSPEQKAAAANDFVLSKVNFDDLYNSNAWNEVFAGWLNIQIQQSKSDEQLLADIQQVGARIKSNAQFTAFADIMVRQLSQKGKDNVGSPFGAYLAKSGRIEKPTPFLLSAMGGPQTGMAAPDLLWKSGPYSFNKKQKTVLVFYEAGCNNCDNEINLLIGNYQELQKKGYEVVSAASDMDKTESEKYSARFPWKNKYCDFNGSTGYNFTTFGVIGTPTIFIIDENGIITGRYARLVDANILN